MLPEGFLFRLMDEIKVGITYINEDDLHKSHEEMEILFEAAKLVNATLNVNQVLENIIRLAQRVIGFDAGGILLFDTLTHEILYDSTYNYSNDEIWRSLNTVNPSSGC